MTQRFLRDDGQFAPIVSSASSAVTTLLTKATTADITNATTSYVDGPSVAQGTSGTWLAIATVTMQSTTSMPFGLKLWDGTTVIDSLQTLQAFGGTQQMSATLAGVITSPVGNIKVSYAPGFSGFNVAMVANFTGGAKDSQLTAIRIG